MGSNKIMKKQNLMKNAPVGGVKFYFFFFFFYFIFFILFLIYFSGFVFYIKNIKIM